METNFQKAIRVIGEFFRDMELSDKIFLALYGIFFTIVGLLFEFGVLGKPVDWKALFGNGNQFEYYIVTYVALSLSNLIMVGMAIWSERGLKNQFKGCFDGGSSYSHGNNYEYRDSFTFNSLLGSILSMTCMILVNIFLFDTFLVMHGIVFFIGGGFALYKFLSSSS